MAPRRRCPTCGSRQWHKEPSSGLIACSEGHVLVNYRNETTEVEEIGPHAMRKRTIKKKRNKKEQSKADPKLYYGARGRFHFLLCLQVILRKQICTLRKLWKLPDEFEPICRDLWALHLSLLVDPVPAPEEDGAATTSKPEGDEDSDLEALMEEQSDVESVTSSDDEQAASESAPKSRRRGRRPEEGILGTLAVLVIALWTLRIPVMYMDISKLITEYQLVYLESIRVLPAEMAEHLTKHDRQGLSPAHAPDTGTLHSTASRLARKLRHRYGIATPDTNGLVLWRATRLVGGTPTVYTLAKGLLARQRQNGEAIESAGRRAAQTVLKLEGRRTEDQIAAADIETYIEWCSGSLRS